MKNDKYSVRCKNKSRRKAKSSVAQLFLLEVAMLKLRMMGTKRDLGWFKSILNKIPALNVVQISEPYENKGTKQYYRMYAEIEKKPEKNS